MCGCQSPHRCRYCIQESQILAYVLEYMTQIRIFTGYCHQNNVFFLSSSSIVSVPLPPTCKYQVCVRSSIHPSHPSAPGPVRQRLFTILISSLSIPCSVYSPDSLLLSHCFSINILLIAISVCRVYFRNRRPDLQMEISRQRALPIRSMSSWIPFDGYSPPHHLLPRPAMFAGPGDAAAVIHHRQS
ncbi:prokineticin-2 isoform X2 [Onychostoma macrolepis]|uniref:prokineticin-2 isoform X2 n=1 Tax=Onychostoma macrolepis TaxID=369639 RepID=UPI00272C010A|nr:prokineticin-2 isoform X2 [Onychostoma macrolepis]